jgi:hypothetical protein
VGVFSGSPAISDSSELMNIKFSVEDPYQGSNRVFKQVLVNCVPQVINLFKVVTIGLLRTSVISLENMVVDYDGDALTYSLVDETTDLARL